jgi:hypothetical protein
MAPDSQMHRGVVHGCTIELQDDVGLPDGQEVTVTVRPISPNRADSPAGEGMRRAFGAWADDGDQLDEFLQWNRQRRKMSRPEVSP